MLAVPPPHLHAQTTASHTLPFTHWAQLEDGARELCGVVAIDVCAKAVEQFPEIERVERQCRAGNDGACARNAIRHLRLFVSVRVKNSSIP